MYIHTTDYPENTNVACRENEELVKNAFFDAAWYFLCF